MVEYTEEEIKEIIKIYKDIGVSDTNRGYAEVCLRDKTLYQVFNPVFHCPLEEVPLYINSWPILVKWRLEHGK